MGRVVRHEIIGYACNLTTCSHKTATAPLKAGTPWQMQVHELHTMVSQGWSLVLTRQLRSYCPVHATRVRDCTCRTNPDRRHLCVRHDAQTQALVWAPWVVPLEAALELERAGDRP